MISVRTPFFVLSLVIYILGVALDNPYQVSIQTSVGSHICSGVIIAARYILTSAHFIADKDRRMHLEVRHVLIGSVNSSEANEKNVFDISQFRMHTANDVVILKVDRDMTFKGHGMVIPLPLNGTTEDTLGEAGGWEVQKLSQQFETADTTSLYLRKTQETVLDQFVCYLRVLAEPIQPEHVCAQSKKK